MLISNDFVCRVGGMSASSLTAFRGERTTSLVSQLFESERKLIGARSALVDSLHALIGKTSSQERSGLVAVKRLVYNGRLPNSKQAERVESFLTDEQQAMLKTLAELAQVRHSLYIEIAEVYEVELAQSREALKQLTADKNFLLGLVHASPTLFRSVLKYRTNELAKSARLQQVERGALRFITRMVTKPTPFGRFCAVVPGELRSANPGAPEFSLEGSGKKRGLIRLNKKLLPVLWNQLSKRDAIRSALRIAVNPSASVDATHITILSSVGRREIFRRIEELMSRSV